MGFALFNIWLSLFLVYCCSVGTVAIKKIFKLEGTSAHPKDHSCEVSLLRIKKIFVTFMVTMAIAAILKMSNCNELQSIFACLFFLYTSDVFKSNRPNR
jgi:hypothetical protein